MGNCPACLSGRYSMVHEYMGSEEGDDQMGSSGGSSTGDGIKVVRVTDGKVFEYKSTASSSDDDDDRLNMQRLRAKDVISKQQGADESGLLYALFDQSHSMAGTGISISTTQNEKRKKVMLMMMHKRKDKGYDHGHLKPLHPETPLKISHVYYLRPAACTATTANSDHNVFSNIFSCPAATAKAPAAIRAATNKKKEKKVRFSDQVVFIEPPAPSSDYNHQRQLDYVLRHTQPIDERQVAVERPAVRVKLLLSKRQLCDLIATTGQTYHQERQPYHSQPAAAGDIFADKLVASHLPPHLAEQLLTSFPQPPSLILSPATHKLIHITS